MNTRNMEEKTVESTTYSKGKNKITFDASKILEVSNAFWHLETVNLELLFFIIWLHSLFRIFMILILE